VPHVPPSSPNDPLATGATTPWVLAAASILSGILSLLLLGVSFTHLLRGWSFAPSIACGVLGVVLGYLARSRSAVLGNRGTVLATDGLVLSYAGTLLPLALFAFIVLSLAAAGPFPPGN
jgi:hypothetical protein